MSNTVGFLLVVLAPPPIVSIFSAPPVRGWFAARNCVGTPHNAFSIRCRDSSAPRAPSCRRCRAAFFPCSFGRLQHEISRMADRLEPAALLGRSDLAIVDDAPGMFDRLGRRSLHLAGEALLLKKSGALGMADNRHPA